MGTYHLLFNEHAKKIFHAPLEPNDHPEANESNSLDEDGRAKYLCMIGQLQWLITLGCLDIMSATVTMSRFRIEPRVGHLDRLKRMYG